MFQSKQAEQVLQKFRKKIICTVFLQQNYHDVLNRRHAHKIFFFCACALFDRRRKLSLVWKTVQVVVFPNNFFAFARSGGGGRAQWLSPSKGLFMFSVPARLSLNWPTSWDSATSGNRVLDAVTQSKSKFCTHFPHGIESNQIQYVI